MKDSVFEERMELLKAMSKLNEKGVQQKRLSETTEPISSDAIVRTSEQSE